MAAQVTVRITVITLPVHRITFTKHRLITIIITSTITSSTMDFRHMPHTARLASANTAITIIRLAFQVQVHTPQLEATTDREFPTTRISHRTCKRGMLPVARHHK